MIDFDLARIYRVPTKVLNQAVKRNAERFPEDFMFRLSAEDLEEIGSQISPIGNRTKAVTGSSKTARLTSQIVTSMNRSQIVTGSQKHRNPRYLPYAFTAVVRTPFQAKGPNQGMLVRWSTSTMTGRLLRWYL